MHTCTWFFIWRFLECNFEPDPGSWMTPPPPPPQSCRDAASWPASWITIDVVILIHWPNNGRKNHSRHDSLTCRLCWRRPYHILLARQAASRGLGTLSASWSRRPARRRAGAGAGCLQTVSVLEMGKYFCMIIDSGEHSPLPSNYQSSHMIRWSGSRQDHVSGTLSVKDNVHCPCRLQV